MTHPAPVIELVGMTSAATTQPDTPDRLERTDAAIEALRAGTASKAEAVYLLASYWTGEGGAKPITPRQLFVITWVTAAVCITTAIIFRGVGMAVLAVVTFGGLFLLGGIGKWRRRNWYGSSERRRAVRSLVGVALERLNVDHDRWVLPREAHEKTG